MCLSTKMSAKKKAEFKEQTEGWKVFRKEGKGFTGHSFNARNSRPVGEWLDEKIYRDRRNRQPRYGVSWNSYRYGWHIWLSIEGVQRWLKEICEDLNGQFVIKKVTFRQPVNYGWQRKHPCVVAKEMMILKGAA